MNKKLILIFLMLTLSLGLTLSTADVVLLGGELSQGQAALKDQNPSYAVEKSGYNVFCEEKKNEIKIKIEIPQLKMEEVTGDDSQVYKKLSIPGSLFYAETEGAPKIPFVVEKVQIPSNSNNVKIQARFIGNPQEYNEICIYPSPKKVIKKTGEGYEYIAEEFVIDKSKYEQNIFLPENMAEISNDGYFRSLRMLELKAYPIQYNSKKNLVKFYNAIEITISYDLDNKKKPKKNTLKRFKDVAEKIVINYKDETSQGEILNVKSESLNIQSENMDINFKTDILQSANIQTQTVGSVVYLTALNLRNPLNEICYLIITHSDFYNSLSLAALAQYRADYNHFNVGIAKVEDIYAEFHNFQGNDYSIKDFMAYAYNNWLIPPEYLMLVGDVEWVPSHISLFMEAMYDNDDWFAYVSGEDEWADLAVGRLSVINEQELENIRNKIVAYEQNEIIPGDYHEKLLYVEGTNGDKGLSADVLRRAWFNVQELYSQSNTKNDFINAFNQGLNFIYWGGHGSQREWEYPFRVEDIAFLNNVDKYPIIMATSCSTADIDYYPVSIGEEFVKAQNKGSVAYYGATNLAGTKPSLEALKEMFDSFEYNLGKMILVGEIRDCIGSKPYILLGDPALQSFGYKLNQQKPDLTLASTDISYDRDTKKLAVKISNIGNADAADFYVKVFIYDADQQSHFFYTFFIDYIASKASVTSEAIVEPMLPSGEYLYSVVVDSENSNDESFELNNQNGRLINTIPESTVTVLKDGIGIDRIKVEAYDSDNIPLGIAETDANGRALFYYILEETQVYFKIYYQESIIPTNFYGAPTNVIVNIPPQSTVTIFENGAGINQKILIEAFRIDEVELGKAGTDPVTSKAIFYIPVDTQVYFKIYYMESVIITDIYTAPEQIVYILHTQDPSIPTTPFVTDKGKFTNRADQLFASWISEDPESGISEYQYQITEDSTSYIGGKIIRPWTSTIGTESSITATELDLIEGKTYFFEVKAKNNAWLWSNVGCSDGITVDITAPITKHLITTSDGIPTSSTDFLSDKPVTITLTATDNLSGVKETLYSINEAPEIKYTAPITISGEGVYVISFYSIDKAENREFIKTIKITVDITAPQPFEDTESFEQGFGAWISDHDDRAASYDIYLTNRAYDGNKAVALCMGGSTDDGTAWIEKSYDVAPNSKTPVEVSFWLRSDWAGAEGVWRVVACVNKGNPKLEEDFIDIGVTNEIAGWKRYSYEKMVNTDSNGKIWVAVGISVVWEQIYTYDIDLVSVKILPPQPNSPPVLSYIGDKNIIAGNTLNFYLNAYDSDPSDYKTLKYSAYNLPSGAIFHDGGDFTWTPQPGQAGRYEVIFGVSDGVLTDSETVTIMVE